MNYSFTVTTGTTSRQVFPSEASNGKLNYSKNENEVFYRLKFSGSFVFDNRNGDYDYFAAIEVNEPCQEFIIDMKIDCGGNYIVRWKGIFSTGSGKFNHDRCLFTVTPITYDDYNCLDKLLKKDYDTLRLVGTGIYTAESSAGTLHTLVHRERYVNGVMVSDNCRIDGVLVTCPNFNKWCFQSQVTDPSPDPDEWFVITTYTREEVLVPVGGGCVAPDPSWTYDHTSGGNCIYYRCGTGVSLVFERCRKLNDIINAILNQAGQGCTLEYSSIFFDYDPDVTDPVYALTSSGLNNYVTGITSATRWLMWAQKSDIKDPLASNPATTGIIKFEKLLQDLRYIFNVYYTVDNGVFKLEHKSYYERFSITIDLTQYKVQQMGKNEYEHLSDEIPSRENFSWMEGVYAIGFVSYDDFIGRPIIYDNQCARAEEVTYDVDDITTDLEYITQYPDLVDDAGFCLISTYFDGTTYNINYEIGLLSGNGKINCHLSWANLHYNYHRHNRFLPQGNMNDVDTNFLSWRPNLKQAAFEIPFCCDTEFDANARFLTILGARYLSGTSATIYSADINLSKETITLTLKYSY